MGSSFVSEIDLKLAPKLQQDLVTQGFEMNKPPYTVFSAKKKGVSCTLYQSGKLMVQGKEMAAFIEFYLEPEILQSFTYNYKDATSAIEVDDTARIGIDESGKGDFFGPLCVAGIFAEGKHFAELQKMGVKDSKEIADGAILKIGKRIRESTVHQIVKINPLKYNELYAQFHNLNKMLAWGHATTIENLVERSGCQNVWIDQFANEHVVLTALKRKNLSLQLTQRHRGEEDLAVAAASILARCAFLEGLQQLGEEVGMKLPKGASAAVIQAGRALVQKYGFEILPKVAKMHFKTVESLR